MTNHDTEILPCDGQWPLYDVIIDGSTGPTSHHMLALLDEARGICGTCPIQRKCWTDNAEEGWVKKLGTRRQPTVIREKCGTAIGGNLHYKFRETPCTPCRNAASAARKARAARQRSAA